MEKTLAPAINWRDTVRHWLIRWLAGSDLVVTNASAVEVVLSPGQKMFAHGCGPIGLTVDQARAEAIGRA